MIMQVKLAHNLAAYDWSVKYQMPTVDMTAPYFTQIATSMLDHFLPQRTAMRHSNDKPWVTDEFRRLIRRRQYAWKTGKQQYRRLRNLVNRTSKQLRKRHYERKVRNLRESNAADWWRETKRFICQSKKSDLCGIINSLADGNVQLMTQKINESLIKVADDLVPLVDCAVANVELSDEYICTFTPA